MYSHLQKFSFDPKVSAQSPSRASTDIESVIYIYAVSLEHPASWGLSVSFAPLEKPLRGDKIDTLNDAFSRTVAFRTNTFQEFEKVKFCDNFRIPKPWVL